MKKKIINCRSCGRIITDSKNKTGICDSCKTKSVAVGGILIGMGLTAKKLGPALLKGSKTVLKGGKTILTLMIKK